MLKAGQYLVAWPGEPVRRHAPRQSEPEWVGEPLEALALPVGDHPVTFGCRGEPGVALRVRLTLQPPERFEMPTP